MDELEINRIDRRFERFRLRDINRERLILNSILGQGIREPLLCAEKPTGAAILLDGFKRFRCALKIGVKVVPVVYIGSDEAGAILHLIRLSNARSLNILEQAMLVDELRQRYRMSPAEIAHRLERSRAWVSVRLGIMGEMSPVVREAVFSGRFPVRSYIYTLRRFTRVNSVKRSETDAFVESVSGKGLSTRDIDRLAYAFFRGGPKLREQIRQGNPGWTLRQLSRCESISVVEESSLSEREKRLIMDLELTGKYMRRVSYGLTGSGLRTPSFYPAANLLAEGILGRIDSFVKTLREFYDQRKQKEGDTGAV